MSTPVTVQPFSQQQLDAIVHQALASSLPDGHTNAIVGMVDEHGAQVVAGFHFGESDRWEFQGAFRHDWSGANEAGAKLICSW